MRIRKAKKKNINKIVDIEMQSGFFKKKEDCFNTLNDLLKDKNQFIFFLSKNFIIRGYISISNKGEIGFLGIDKKLRKKGFGGKLLRKVLKFAKKKKIKRVYLDVRTNNQSAKSLYLKHGFLIKKVDKSKKPNKVKMEKLFKF